eukprot:TRINITY_DN2799_c0_g1_i1.p1 TRINITY_DN2799_c0_g1~~TRINITY_DN2799_c0_g1_i1.p1  ORF type:complete len:369 (+),score=123.82 TRINITY_DN2799_c0_g1_i1:58-1164(+)
MAGAAVQDGMRTGGEVVEASDGAEVRAAGRLMDMLAAAEAATNAAMDDAADADRAKCAAVVAQGNSLAGQITAAAARAPRAVRKPAAKKEATEEEAVEAPAKAKKNNKKKKAKQRPDLSHAFGFEGLTGRGGMGSAGEAARAAAADLVTIRSPQGYVQEPVAVRSAEDVVRRCEASAAAGEKAYFCGWCFAEGFEVRDEGLEHVRACPVFAALHGDVPQDTFLAEAGYAVHLQRVITRRLVAMHDGATQGGAVCGGFSRRALRDLLLSLGTQLAAVGLDPEDVYEEAVFPPSDAPLRHACLGEAGGEEEWGMFGGQDGPGDAPQEDGLLASILALDMGDGADGEDSLHPPCPSHADPQQLDLTDGACV